MRVATFNIKHAQLSGLEVVAATLREARADVVAVQEVDCGTRRSGSVDQAATLGRLLGMTHVFAPAMEFDGGEYGCALLCTPALAGRLPLQVVALPGGSGPGEEPRVLLLTRAAGLRIAVTHFDLPAAVRVRQADAVLAALGSTRGTVLLGDFNEGPRGPAVSRLLRAGLRDAWVEAGARERVTAPGDRPQERIDLVLLGEGVGPARSATALDAGASDHPLVVVEL